MHQRDSLRESGQSAKVASAFATQPGSFAPLPFATAFAWHRTSAEAFFAAARSSFDEHLLLPDGAGVVVVVVPPRRVVVVVPPPVAVVVAPGDVVVVVTEHGPKVPIAPALFLGVGHARSN